MTEHATKNWRHNASCKSIDGELWFPVEESADTSSARKVCLDCPVRWECGAHALLAEERDGIWAGYWMRKSKERNALVRALPEVAARLNRATCTECGEPYRPPLADNGKCRPCIRGLVPAEPVRVHVHRLHETLTYQQISALAGITRGALFNVMTTRGQHMSKETAEALLSVPLLAVTR